LAAGPAWSRAHDTPVLGCLAGCRSLAGQCKPDWRETIL
jgi:hypothetical protein